MGQNLWRSLVLRDHLLTLIDQPLSQTEVTLPEKENDITLIKESSEEANKVINDPLEDLCKELRKNWKGQEISQPQDWKKFYMDCNNKLNLSGEWEGNAIPFIFFLC